MDLGVMVDGQAGLDWNLWRRIIGATEDSSFESLWRSDHFFSLSGPRDRDALETFISFTVVAQKSESIRFGPLVSSMTQRSWLVGSPAQIVDQLGRREEAGVIRSMLQHHASDDFATLELIASEVLSQVQRS
jgi:alkanesulfonate monooxygenase SsuD/methylene tetrahydromethanopterin reductase-like flavin-dependent oxidoreductase (luciferase family)